MGVRVVFPDMGKDPSVQLIEKTITENGTYDAITDGANGYSKVNVNVEGGGGSSDFSTAEVTVNAAGTPPTEIYWNDSPSIEQNIIKGAAYANVFPTVLSVPLYKGKCFWTVSTEGLTLSGNIERYNDGYNDGLLITGDCTITINQA